MTIIIDDAGIGDLLFGVVIGAFRPETQEFAYDVLNVDYFKAGRFGRKEYLAEASHIVFQLLLKLKLRDEELIHLCRGYVFDEAAEELKRAYGKERVHRVTVTGDPQRLTETAYLDELRNLGYEPLARRAERRAKSFFHMMSWLNRNPEKLVYAKTGWPRLARYRLFRSYNRTHRGNT